MINIQNPVLFAVSYEAEEGAPQPMMAVLDLTPAFAESMQKKIQTLSLLATEVAPTSATYTDLNTSIRYFYPTPEQIALLGDSPIQVLNQPLEIATKKFSCNLKAITIFGNSFLSFESSHRSSELYTDVLPVSIFANGITESELGRYTLPQTRIGLLTLQRAVFEARGKVLLKETAQLIAKAKKALKK